MKLNDVRNKIHTRKFKLSHSLRPLIEKAGLGFRYEQILHNSIQESTTYAVWVGVEQEVKDGTYQHESK